MYPKINLSIDTCFASKRWSEPEKWLEIICSAGVKCVEISADCDCDPLYVGEEYLLYWADKVLNEAEKRNMRAVSFYSGHSTYSTTGLAHPDVQVRNNLLENWVRPYARAASLFGSGIGFYQYAFTDDVLQSPEKYSETYAGLVSILKESDAIIRAQGCRFTAVEQMYTPQQIPWTIDGTARLIRETGTYTTIDTGHQSAQNRFIRPLEEDIYASINSGRHIYVGSDNARKLLCEAIDEKRLGREICGIVSKIEEDMNRHPYLFCEKRDSDLYEWIAELGAYSPIIHLQQSDGTKSNHLPFTEKNNGEGIVTPEKLLSALKKSYDDSFSNEADNTNKGRNGMPSVCDTINLTLEMFFPLYMTGSEIIEQINESVEYWRRAVPRDGMTLDELI